jgi:type I restriction-modification system DNA methylase subunit
MRLEGRAKAGYYPTPDSVVQLIASCLKHSPNAALLDPCCGTGDALYRIAQHVGGTPWGIELSDERHQLATQLFKEAQQGDAMAYEAKGFSLLYLNPPYDQTFII